MPDTINIEFTGLFETGPQGEDGFASFATIAEFPEVGVAGKLYFAEDSSLFYRWDGAAYAQATPSSHESLPDLQGGSDGEHYHLTQSEHLLSSGLGALYNDTLDPTGIVDGPSVGVSYDATTRTLTLTHASGTIDYYWQGELVSVESPLVIPAHDDVDGRYFATSTDGDAIVWSSSAWQLWQLQLAAIAYYPARGFSFGIREPHGFMPWPSHRADHLNRGTYRASGLGPTSGTYTIDTETDAAVTPGFDAGVIYDEDNESSIAASTEGVYTTFRVGAGVLAVFDTTATFPYRSAPGGFIYINDPETGGETEAATNRYVNVYELCIPVTDDAESQKFRRVVIQPQRSFTSLSAAQAESPTTVDLGDLTDISMEFVAYTRLTYRTNAGYTTTGKVQLAGVSYVVGSREGQFFIQTAAAPTAENIPLTPTGGVAGTNVQSGIGELATIVTQVEAEAGVSTTLRAWTVERVWQVVAKFITTARAYIISGGYEPTTDYGLIGGAQVLAYANSIAFTLDATDCDLSFSGLPASGNIGSMNIKVTTGATLPATLGGTASPDWQVELLGLLAVSSTQTFEAWCYDGATVRINEVTYSGQ
jgi:hypothetical protein